MSNNNINYSIVLLKFFLAALLAVTGLASCGGSSTDSATTVISVIPIPTVSVSASPSSTIAYGATSSITWTSTNSASCTSPGGGGTGTTGSFATGALTTTTTYTVTCTGTGGSASQSTTVTVGAAAAPVVTITALPSSIANGATSTISWLSTNSTSCNSPSGGGSGTSGSFTTPALTANTTYSVSCTGPGGTASQSKTVSVAAVPAPTVTISASPSSIASSETSTLSWSSTNSTSCTSSGGGGTGTSGSFTTPALTTNTSYTVTCTGPGGTASKNTTVSVSAGAYVSLAVTIAGTGAGSVSSPLGSISCGVIGNACLASYTSSTTITLTATPSTGSTFSGWSGDCSGTGTCTVSMAQARNVTATFALVTASPGTYTLTVSKTGPGTGVVSSSPSGISSCGGICSATYNTGTSVTLTATPGTGSTFSGWSGGGCSGTGTCTTSVNADTTITSTFTLTQTTSPSVPTTIADVAAAWAATPYQSGKITYYCDCGTGASGSCVAGNDSNSGLTTALPKRTIANAISTLNSAASGDTVALCQGGAFNAASGFSITRTSCTPGTTCVDLREYTPTTFAGTAKPVINNAGFTSDGNRGGVRFLNFAMNGNGSGSGFFFYNGAHDITIGNLDINNFDIGIYNAGSNQGTPQAVTTNIKATGNKITGSHTFGYLGAGNSMDISYNYWEGNGSSTTFDHTIYLSSATLVTNVSFVGNYIHGQYGSTCLGVPMVGHAHVDGLTVSGNTIDIDAGAATGGCWGIAFNNVTGDVEPMYFRNAKFSGNTIINGGNTAFNISGCPDCIIENNLIIQNWNNNGSIGISLPIRPARSQDDVNTRNIVRNNTVWFGPNSGGNGVGIIVGTEGIGHIVANNVVYNSSATGSTCFDNPLPSSSYAFIGNNNCSSGTGSPFTNAPSNFAPAAGSPLISAGNALYGSALDITGKARPVTPAIGAFEP